MSILEERFFKKLNQQRREDFENEKQRKFHKRN